MEKWKCPKCGNEEYEKDQFQATGGNFAKIFDVQNKKFITISCTKCGYTELYKTGTSAAMNIFDFLMNQVQNKKYGEKIYEKNIKIWNNCNYYNGNNYYRYKFICENKQIVTQKYHLYRALYIAKQLDLEAYGVGTDPRQYVGATYREIREILARDKDFIKCIFKPEPTYLGETIPASGNGDVTND